jgi:hypothetical protein
VAKRMVMAKPAKKASPLLYAGGAAVAYAVYKTTRSKRPGVTDEQFFSQPPQDYALMPSAMRQVLVARNGPVAFVNGMALPVTYTTDMENIFAFWKRLADMARDVTLSRAGTSWQTPLLRLIGVGDDIPDRLLVNGIVKLKMRMLPRIAALLLKPAPTLIEIASMPFTKYGTMFATPDETKEFWYTIDRTAIAIAARLSWDPNVYNSYWSAVGATIKDFYDGQMQASKKIREAAGKLAGEGVKVAGNLAASILWDLLKQPVFLIGGLAVGAYFTYPLWKGARS